MFNIKVFNQKNLYARLSIFVLLMTKILLTEIKQTPAQVIPDQSLGNESAIVIPFDQFIQLIQGGAIRGENLFQSFQDFNIQEGQNIVITNPNGINNILIRVTGDNPSQLLGALSLIKAETINNIISNLPNPPDLSQLTINDLGTANLFFLNPNGILFGENASINLGGSFIATTANEIQFADGTVFSADITKSTPLLTVSTPIGLNFTQPTTQTISVNEAEKPLNNFLQSITPDLSPEEESELIPTIISEIFSRAGTPLPTGGLEFSGLNVFPNQTLALIGGDVNLSGGILTSLGGNISIASVADEGSVNLTPKENGWDIGLENIPLESQGTVELSQLALINPDISNSGNGEVTIQGKNLNLIDESAIVSFNSNINNQGKNINIRGKDINIQNGVVISTGTISFGNSGDVIFQADNLDVSQSSFVGNLSLESQGNGGNLMINIQNDLNVNQSFLRLVHFSEGEGGDIFIQAKNINLTEGGLITSQAFSTGNAGDINIIAEELINLETSYEDNGFVSIISNDTAGDGNGGSIEIKTKNLTLTNLSVISSDAEFLSGNAGNVIINVEENINLTGINARISTLSNDLSFGNGGNIEINASQINLNNGATINSETQGIGNAGKIFINANELKLNSGSIINVETQGKGNAGNIDITANIATIGENAELSARTTAKATGKAGNINLNTNQLNVSGNLGIFAETEGEADAGNLTINPLHNNADLTINFFNRGEISASTSANGNGGDITITADENINISGEGEITVKTEGSGNAGTIEITTENLSLVDGININASTASSGNSGDINLTTQKLNLSQGAKITANTTNQGQGGNIQIYTNSFNVGGTDSGIFSTSQGSGKAGNIEINSDSLTLQNNGIISTDAQSSGNAGNININNQNQLLINNNSQISSSTSINSQGEGGEIRINSNSLALENQGQINTLSEGLGNAGNINLNIDNSFNADDGKISANANQAGGGEIKINAQNIRLRGDSDIRTNVNSGAGNGGNITITTDSIINFNDSDILAFARDGRGGNIFLNTPIFFGDGYQPSDSVNDPNSLDGNGRVDINATGAVSGAIVIPDLTYIENSLVQLPESLINPDNLIANTCVVPNSQQQGTFIIKGSGGLPTSPTKSPISPYPTGTVQPLPDHDDNINDNQSWQKGDPIIEPQGMFKTTDGKLILSRQCP